MFRLDPHHTNRSPFRAPRAPREVWAYDTGGPVAAAPAVVNGLVVVASLSGRVAALSADGAPRWKIELGERIYGSPLVVGETIYLGLDRGRFLALRAGNGSSRFVLDVDGDADTGAVPLPGGGLAFAAGKIVYSLRPDGAVRFRHKLRRKVFSSPVVGDDGAIFFGGQDDYLTALMPDGTTRFRLRLGADADASPAIGDDGTVHVGTDDGEVWAVSPRDGAVRWKSTVGGYVRGPLSIGRDGAVFASSYGPTPAVVALDGGDGRELWRFTIRGTGALEFGVHGAPLEDAEGTLVFGGQDDFVYALSPDGALLWKTRVGGDVDAAVILAEDGALYVGSEDGKLHAFRDGDG
jgi:outer membrane protein assembly factor BamB